MRRLPVFLTLAVTTITAVAAVAAGYGVSSGRTSADEPDAATATTSSPEDDADCGPATKRQRQLESDLTTLGDYGELTVDGRQSAAECDVIAAFQERMGVEPADGRADAVTASVARRLAEPDFDACPTGSGTTVCVDLTAQLLWVTVDGELSFGPTVVRTGKKGYASTTGGFTLNHRTEREWSEPFEQWLPYFQHYYAGEGLHETTSYLHDPKGGSHGCVNLLPADARRLYELLDYGDAVEVFGKRPGT